MASARPSDPDRPAPAHAEIALGHLLEEGPRLPDTVKASPPRPAKRGTARGQRRQRGGGQKDASTREPAHVSVPARSRPRRPGPCWWPHRRCRCRARRSAPASHLALHAPRSPRRGRAEDDLAVILMPMLLAHAHAPRWRPAPSRRTAFERAGRLAVGVEGVDSGPQELGHPCRGRRRRRSARESSTRARSDETSFGHGQAPPWSCGSLAGRRCAVRSHSTRMNEAVSGGLGATSRSSSNFRKRANAGPPPCIRRTQRQMCSIDPRMSAGRVWRVA